MKRSVSSDSEQRRHVNINSLADRRAAKTSGFTDNRSDVLAQRRLIAGIAASPRMVAQRQAAESIHASPRMITQRKLFNFSGNAVAQLQSAPEDELLQGRFDPVQRMEEEEPLQGKFDAMQRMEDEEMLQGKFMTVQKMEEEEPLQGKSVSGVLVQREETSSAPLPSNNNTGLPDNLKSGIESLSGISMDNVRVHYNSDKPAQLNALAYAQGTDIHLATGQEQHLPHEAWHVVQQAQGRVKPTMQLKEGVPVNDDHALEQEADVMGNKSLELASSEAAHNIVPDNFSNASAMQLKSGSFQLQVSGNRIIQTRFDAGIGAGWHIHYGDHVKYNGNDATRVNFTGRTRRQIGYAWEQVIQNYGLAGTKANQDFIDCKTWIRNNIA